MFQTLAEPTALRLAHAFRRAAASARAGVGVAAGLLTAAAFAAGLPAWPLSVAFAAAAVADWTAAREGAAARLEGAGVGALVGLAAARGLFAGPDWDVGGCTGFTGQPWRIAVTFAVLPLAFAALDGLVAGRRRVAVAAGLTVLAVALALAAAPGCRP